LQLVLRDPSSWVCVLGFVLLIFHYYIWFDDLIQRCMLRVVVVSIF
jgi:hypothetical protein